MPFKGFVKIKEYTGKNNSVGALRFIIPLK
jgi:hypothetical protein